jgi:hypothetical protein
MKTQPMWLRILIGAAGVLLVSFAAYKLILQATASAGGAATVATVLALWLIVYLVWGRKLAAKLRSDKADNS